MERRRAAGRHPDTQLPECTRSGGAAGRGAAMCMNGALRHLLEGSGRQVWQLQEWRARAPCGPGRA
eukprot:4042887-Pleurochrysis_carterae.AAC.1